MDIVTYALCKKMAGGKGEKGDKGDKGDQGLPGRDGVDGVTPNLQVGDVVTLEAGQQASITRRGDDENPIFDFAIPKGDTGKDGIFVGRVDDAPDHAQVVVNDDASPYDLFFENANVSYMGDTYTSLKEKSDADIEYLLREIQTQHYEGQRITATNTYQKQVKSAILKGQTLVNLFEEVERQTEVDKAYRFFKVIGNQVPTLKPNTKYTLIFDKYVEGVSTVIYKTHSASLMTDFYTFGKSFCFTTIEDVGTEFHIFIKGNTVEIAEQMLKLNPKIVILEGDYTNVNIPYFEGMKSVKMPVLTTQGKNWIDIRKSVDGFLPDSRPYDIAIPDNFDKTSDYTKVEPNTTYCYSVETPFDGAHVSRWFFYKDIGVVSSEVSVRKMASGVTKMVITTPSDCNYIRICSRGLMLDGATAQLEKSPTPTTHEPYKSNILSINGEYRGIGNVQDTLDLNTGEKVERIGEMILNGNEKWATYSGGGEKEKTVAFRIPSSSHIHSWGDGLGACDKLPFVNGDTIFSKDIEGITSDANGFIIRISKKKCTDLQSLKVYLLSNPIKIQYRLKTPIIKTVDLNNQKVYSYDGTTHYTTSSGVEGHPAPILSIDVPTNLPALVSRQRDTIKDLEKENEALKEEVAVVDQQRESGDLELLSSDFDLDFRLMEIEFALDIPIAATFKEVRNMARTPYEMAKILILGGKYERSDMEYKLGKYLERKQITQAQYDELIALMEANELVV